MSGGRGRAGGGGGGSNASSSSSSSSRAASSAKRRAPSPAAPSHRWPAAAAAGIDSSFGELWGAVNAVAAGTGIKKLKKQVSGLSAMLEPAAAAATATATRTKQQQQPQPRPRGIIRAHRPPRPVSTRATAATGAADFPSSSSPSPPLLLPKEVAARLDRAAPAPSALDLAVALLAAALAFALTSALAHLRGGSAFDSGSTALSLLAALAAFALALSTARERAFAARSLHARELADPDSRFAELLGVEVHYKVAKPLRSKSGTNPFRFSIGAMHGFGAAAFSWSLVARPLAERLGARFTKHDMPGFGLTERPSKLGLAPYSLAFNGRLARAVMDLEEKEKRGELPSSSSPSALPSPPPLRVLMGHSLGAVCAAAEAARDPGGVDALVLVAPAIVAERRRIRKEWGESSGGDSVAAPETKKQTFSTLPMRVLTATTLLLSSVAALVAGWATRALIVLSWPFLVFLLRMAVRSFDFWERGLSAALGGGGQGGASAASSEAEAEAELTPAGIPLWLSQRYRLPSLVRGWETGFLLFLLARVPVASGGVFGALARAAADAKSVMLGKKCSSSSNSSSPLTSGPPVARLAAAVRGGRVPLLVVHGDRDALVPLANSARLVDELNDFSGEKEETAPAPALCELVVLRGRGHTPQEEAPVEFVEAVAAFLERVERAKREEEEQEKR